VVLAVRHSAYLELNPDEVVGMTGRPVAVVDCFGILSDDQIGRYFELGCEVKGLGRGHVKPRHRFEPGFPGHGHRRCSQVG
jgi:UDP-N-acetyl-D-glucosamine dehydrogenase